jgi:hypothetical protein
MVPQLNHLVQASSAMLWPTIQATLAKKVWIEDWYYGNGKNQTTTSTHFLCSNFPTLNQSSFPQWLQKDQLFCNIIAASTSTSMKRCRSVTNYYMKKGFELGSRTWKNNNSMDSRGKSSRQLETKFIIHWKLLYKIISNYHRVGFISSKNGMMASNTLDSMEKLPLHFF